MSLYDVDTGGTALWTETKGVAVSSGNMATMLGDTTAIPPSVTFDRQYYVGVKIGDDAEMTPRLPFGAVPYALAMPNVYSVGGNVSIGTSVCTDAFRIGSSLAFHSGGNKVIGFGYSPTLNKATLDGYPAEIRWAPTDGRLSLATSSNPVSFGSTPTLQTLLSLRQGNVGIGTTSPAQRLTVKGPADQPSVIALESGDTAPQWASIHFNDRGTIKWGIGKKPDNSLEIGDGIASRLAIVPGGNVGIGTGTPQTKLDVAGDATASGALISGSGSMRLDGNGLRSTGRLHIQSGENLYLNPWEGAGAVYIGGGGGPGYLEVRGDAGVAGSVNTGGAVRPGGGIVFPDGSIQTTAVITGMAATLQGLLPIRETTDWTCPSGVRAIVVEIWAGAGGGGGGGGAITGGEVNGGTGGSGGGGGYLRSIVPVTPGEVYRFTVGTGGAGGVAGSGSNPGGTGTIGVDSTMVRLSNGAVLGRAKGGQGGIGGAAGPSGGTDGAGGIGGEAVLVSTGIRRFGWDGESDGGPTIGIVGTIELPKSDTYGEGGWGATVMGEASAPGNKGQDGWILITW